MARKRHSLLSGVQSVVVTGLLTAIGGTGLSLWTVPSLAAESSASEILVPLSAARDDPGSLVVQAIRLCDSGQCQDAVGLLQQAVAAYRAAGDWLNLSRTLSNLSLVYQRLGNLKAAETAIDDSLAALISADDSQRQLRLRASALEVKGQLHLAMGQSQQALESWQEAETTYQSVKDGEGKIRSQLHQSSVLQEMGLYREAFKRLLPIVQMLQTQPDSPLKAVALRSLGKVVRVVVDEEALEQSLPLLLQHETGAQKDYLWQSERLLEKSAEISERLLRSQTIVSAEIRQNYAAALLELGNTARAVYIRASDLSDRKTAEEKAKAALNYYEQVVSLPSDDQTFAFPSLHLQAKLNQLSLLIDCEQWLANTKTQWDNNNKTAVPQLDNLLSAIAQIQTDIQKLSINRETIYVRIHLARSLIEYDTLKEKPKEFQHLSSVEQLLRDAVQQAEELQDSRVYAYALGHLGKLHEYLGQRYAKNELEQFDSWNRAQSLTQKALILSESIQAPDLAYQWHWQLGRLLENQSYLLRVKNELAQSTEKFKQAILAYESAIQELDIVRHDLLNTNPDVQFSFRDDVEPLYRDLVALLLPIQDSVPGQENLKKAVYYIDELQVAELENFLRCNLANEGIIPSGIGDNRYSPATALIEQIDRVFEDNSTSAFIYPLILAKQLVTILKLPGKDLLYHPIPFNLKSSTTDKEAVQKTIDKARKILTERYFIQGHEKPFQKLYKWLIAEFEENLEANQIKTLIFVLDDPLRSIPMAALHDGNRFLVQKEYAVALAPSVQILKPKRSEKVRLNILAAGSLKKRPNFDELRWVTNQIELIEKLFANSKILLGEEFTTQSLRREMEAFSYNIVHLATHGQFSSNWKETFVLTDDNSDKLDDYSIDINELGRLLQIRGEINLSPLELLVLSACQTAQGDKRAVLGIAGVAVRSGANSTVAPMWTVQQESSTLLVEKFYEALVKEVAAGKRMSQAEALRLAQKSLLEDPTYEAPYYWAPFILVGY